MDGTVVVAAIGLLTTAASAIIGPLLLERRRATVENRRERLRLAVQLAVNDIGRVPPDPALRAPTESLAALVIVHFRCLGLIEDASAQRKAAQIPVAEVLGVRDEVERALYPEQRRERSTEA